jgi:hypothetical protein
MHPPYVIVRSFHRSVSLPPASYSSTPFSWCQKVARNLWRILLFNGKRVFVNLARLPFISQHAGIHMTHASSGIGMLETKLTLYGFCSRGCNEQWHDRRRRFHRLEEVD